MPFIQVTLGAGRTDEQKQQLVRAVSKAAAEAVGVPETGVRVWLVEVPAELVMAGGQTLAERTAAAGQAPG
ncbi:tautomerase family protein [Pseudonocardia xinjiangensis]|uniref:tautomerase family protein n=1 Tax=Pseudonocardia xinjiangensis TaxID=75289 RepID=UPI003D8ABCAF